MNREKRKSSLARKFTKAVLGLALTASCLYGGWFGAFYAGRGEALTPGETSAVTAVFGNEINASAIRKHERSEGSATHLFRWVDGMVPPPFSHIDFYGPDAHARDYTQDDARLFRLFMHEVTHTWQGQNFNFSRHQVGVYKYQLNENSKFSDFGTEQQAEIICDYSGKFLHQSGLRQKRTAEDLLLQRVVEARFPTARQTRLSIEQGRMAAFNRVAPDTPRMASPSTPAPVFPPLNPPRPA